MSAPGFPGRDECVVVLGAMSGPPCDSVQAFLEYLEGRDGLAGAPRVLGGLGAMSGPPCDSVQAFLEYLEGRDGLAGAPRVLGGLGVWGPCRGPHVISTRRTCAERRSRRPCA